MCGNIFEKPKPPSMPKVETTPPPPPQEAPKVELSPKKKKKTGSKSAGKSRLTIPMNTSGRSGLGTL